MGRNRYSSGQKKEPTGFIWGQQFFVFLKCKKGMKTDFAIFCPEDCTSVLDCTFGQGRDSVILSWYLRKRGEVISLERSRPLYEVGKEGLAALSGQDGEMTEALRRIQLLHADFRGFLETAAPNSFDVI